MKYFGNTLYITTQGVLVKRDGKNLVMSVARKEIFRIPIHAITSVVSFGNVLWTPFALGLCGENGVATSFLTESGRFLARSIGKQRGNVLLRRAQFERSRDPQSASLAARAFISGKIANSRTVLLRARRDYRDKINVDALDDAVRTLARSVAELLKPVSVDTVRGIEGAASRKYFSVFDSLIVSQKDSFQFVERTRRPPRDKVNALLSFVYTLLNHDVAAACEAFGLDPQVGFLHMERSGRLSLAMDLMEEFRPYLSDRLALSLVNRKQVSGKDFTVSESGAVLMNESARKTVLKAWQDRKSEEIVHPFLGEKTKVGLLPFLQVQLLTRWLRGDLNAYPPFMWK